MIYGSPPPAPPAAPTLGPDEAYDAIKVGNRRYTVVGKSEHVHDQDFLIHVMHGFALAQPGEYMFQGVKVIVEAL